MVRRNLKEEFEEAVVVDGKPAPDIKNYPLFCSTRITMALVLFLGYVLLYCQRVNLSVGMVCMVNHTALSIHDKTVNTTGVNDTFSVQNPVTSSSCSRSMSNYTSKTVDGPMVWSKQLQGIALSSFFWGYVLTQVPGGWLAARYGAKNVLLVSLGAGSIVTTVAPILARFHFGLFVAGRVLLGVLHGMVFPASHVLWTRWSPPAEKSRLVSFSYAGAQIGNVIAMPISGMLCVYGIDGGWPSVFYLFGVVGIIWSLLWLIFGASTPKEHRCISGRERDFIEFAIGSQVADKTVATPWMKIFTSLPMWAITVANVTEDFGIYVFLTNLPTYMKESLGFTAEMSGVVSALPYIGFWLVMNVSAVIADKLIEAKALSVTNVRKMFNGLGLLVPAGALIALTLLKCDSVIMAVILLTIGVAFCGSGYGAGFLVNHTDIAPQFAGILLGISNGIGTLSGMFGPAMVGVMTQKRTPQEWCHVFYLTAGIMAFGSIFYFIFGSGEPQNWTEEEREKDALEIEAAEELMSNKV